MSKPEKLQFKATSTQNLDISKQKRGGEDDQDENFPAYLLQL